MEKERKKWKKEDLEVLKDLLSKGYTYKEISSVLDRSYDSIRSIVKRIRRSDTPSKNLSSPEVRGGGKRSRGLLDLSNEEARELLSGIESGSDNINRAEKRGRAVNRGVSKSYMSSWVLSDYEVSKVIERYLKRTSNIEGAKNLWKLHLQYKRRHSAQYDD